MGIRKPTQQEHAENIKAWVDEQAKHGRLISVSIGTNEREDRIVLTVEADLPPKLADQIFEAKALGKP